MTALSLKGRVRAGGSTMRCSSSLLEAGPRLLGESKWLGMQCDSGRHTQSRARPHRPRKVGDAKWCLINCQQSIDKFLVVNALSSLFPVAVLSHHFTAWIAPNPPAVMIRTKVYGIHPPSLKELASNPMPPNPRIRSSKNVTRGCDRNYKAFDRSMKPSKVSYRVYERLKTT